MRFRPTRVFVLGILALGLWGCRAPEETSWLGGEPQTGGIYQRREPQLSTPPLSPTSRAGQSFVSPFDGLTRIAVFLFPKNTQGCGALIFRLKDQPQAAADLATVTIPGEKVVRGPHAFSFPALYPSAGRSLSFSLETASGTEDCQVSVGYTTLPDHHPSGGTRYENDRPAEGDLAFWTYHRVSTEPGQIAGETVERLGADLSFWGGFALAMVTVLYLFRRSSRLA